MLDRELLQKIWQVAKESSAYEKLARYIEKNYLHVVFMTAEETASSVGVSQGTVSRFCMAMGYRGFNEFIRTLQHVVSRELTGPARLELTSDEASQTGADLLNKEAANIVSLASVLCDAEYEKFVDMMVNARHLVLLSARMSATLLPYMEYLLDKMRGGVITATPGSRDWNRLYLLNPEETGVFVIAFPRYSAEVIEKLREIRSLGFPVYAMTDSRFSPVVELADHTLFVPLTVSSIFDMYGTPLSLLNLLLRDVSMRIESLSTRMEQIEAYDISHNVYWEG